MWPPIGFSAPPATNVIVAPGSAAHGMGLVSELNEYDIMYAVLTLHLVSNKDSDL
jgi:hypothetical protein